MPKAITEVEFFERIKAKFDSKYNFTTVNGFSNLSSIIKVECPCHGKTNALAKKLWRGDFACARCGDQSRSSKTAQRNISSKIPWSDRIAQFRKVHGDKFIYSTEHNGNKNSKIAVICPTHGEFSIHLFAHLNGRGCFKCKLDSSKKTERKRRLAATSPAERELNRISSVINANVSRITPIDDMRVELELKFGNRFIYHWNTYTGRNKLMKMECRIHGEFYKTPIGHKNSKHGCNSCAKFSTSQLETEWLDKLNISDRQQWIKTTECRMKVDGIDYSTNTIYEFLGDYWHGHPSQNNRYGGINKNSKLAFTELFTLTEKRLLTLKELGYNVMYIWENDILTGRNDPRIFLDILEF